MPLFPHHTNFSSNEVTPSFPNKLCITPTLNKRITEIATTYLSSTSHKGKLFRVNTLGQICVDDKVVFDVPYELPEFLAGSTNTDGAGNGDYDLWFSWVGSILSVGTAQRQATGYGVSIGQSIVVSKATSSPTAFSASFLAYLGESSISLSSGTVNNWLSGTSIPAGQYRIKYERHAWRPWNGDPSGGWCVMSVYNSPNNFGPRIKYNNGSAEIKAPGATAHYPSELEAQSASSGQYVDIVHTGGAIGVYLYDTPYLDNGGNAVTYSLSRLS